jgi:hypothetical protein
LEAAEKIRGRSRDFASKNQGASLHPKKFNPGLKGVVAGVAAVGTAKIVELGLHLCRRQRHPTVSPGKIPGSDARSQAPLQFGLGKHLVSGVVTEVFVLRLFRGPTACPKIFARGFRWRPGRVRPVWPD